MASITAFLIIYVLGGITFIPLVLAAILTHAYFFFPVREEPLFEESDDEGKSRAISGGVVGEEDQASKSRSGSLSEKLGPRSHESDVAAGYFAVCREYVPGGVNGKPPERITPGGAVIGSESPSVYQSMYRSIFDRKQAPTLEAGKNSKRFSNVFYVVLRLGTLMLYLDSEQMTLRHVFSLAHYDVGLHGGDDEKIPEGELWIRRNAICLTRKPQLRQTNPDGTASHQLFLFSDNCSEKEDFYFALLQNQERKPDALDNPPRPLQYDVKHLISLVQRLHSSEEQLQTRWINALVGRLFLALYKTKETQEFVHMKISKKIARVKKPAFLSDIVLRSVHMGEGAPYITNPRLKDLTVDGICAAEADVKYTGNFRIEIGTKAKIELGGRIKAREVNLVLAVVFKKVEGHAIIRFKPPPSNRLWVSFETMPKIEMSIEPIVSSRQITYGLILRQIESRIREVIAETLVHPHWDDIPFTHTDGEEFRGGIWDDGLPQQALTETPVDGTAESVASESVDETEELHEPEPGVLRLREKTRSMPDITPDAKSSKSRKSGLSSLSKERSAGASTSALDARKRMEKPKAVRVGSFANAADPVVSMDATNVDALRGQKDPNTDQNATSAMIAISSKSQPASPAESPAGTPPQASLLGETIGSMSSTSSRNSYVSETTQETQETSSDAPSRSSPAAGSPASFSAGASKTFQGFGNDPQRNSLGTSRGATTEKKQPIAALGSAAKKWGWGMMKTAHERRGSIEQGSDQSREGSFQGPIGRGQPIPYAAEGPLPEARRTRSSPGVPRRKPLPPPVPSPRPDEIKHRNQTIKRKHANSADSTANSTTSSQGESGNHEDIMIVSVPSDEDAQTPIDEKYEDTLNTGKPDEELKRPMSKGTRTIPEPDSDEEELDTPRRLSSPRSAREQDPSQDVVPRWNAAEQEARSTQLWLESGNGDLS